MRGKNRYSLPESRFQWLLNHAHFLRAVRMHVTQEGLAIAWVLALNSLVKFTVWREESEELAR